MTTQEFRKQYDKDHAACPKCGEITCMSTMIGFPIYENDMESFQDKNLCTCMNCGDKHTRHDRVPASSNNSVNYIETNETGIYQTPEYKIDIDGSKED